MITSEAVLWWKQLLSEVGIPSETGHPGILGAYAKDRHASIVELFFQCCDVASCLIMLEVGAFRADTSKRFVASGQGRTAHAFEAAPANFAENKEQANIEGLSYIPMAIGAKTGTVEFRVARDPYFRIWGSAGRRHGFDDVDVVNVEMTTIDSYIGRNSINARSRDIAAWIDVEGLGYDVLCGGEKTCGSAIAVIYIETDDYDMHQVGRDSIDVIQKLLSMDFIPVARDREYGATWNLLAVHKSIMPKLAGILAHWHYREGLRCYETIKACV